MIGAQFEELSLLLSGPNGSDADGSLKFRGFDRGDTNTAARGSDDDKVVSCHLSFIDERSVGGYVLHPDGSAFLIIKMSGILSNGRNRNDGDFAIDAIDVGGKGWNRAGSFAQPERVNAGSNGFNDAGSRKANLRWKPWSKLRMSILTKISVSAIQAYSLHAKANLALTGLGKRKFVDLKNLRWACPVKAHDLCSFSSQGTRLVAN